MPPLKDWIQSISFLTSASKTAELPADGPGEIAIAGRSNAGKSSAMNLICNRRRLAFSSKTPGRTQLMNVFSLHHNEQEVGRLVDLPGYGYAAVSQAIKARWQRELATFLETRASLVGLILVMDIRHPFGPLDRQMLQWFDHRNRPIHVLLTKADKLTRNEQSIALTQARRLIAQENASWGRNCSVSLFSASQRLGRDEAVEKIAQWWHLPPAQPEPKVAKKNPAR
jgi:GTP-binding protein